MGNDVVYAIIAGFAVLSLMLALRLPIWAALIASSTAIGLIHGGPKELLTVAVNTSTSATTVSLIIVTALIALFVGVYRESGLVKDLGDGLVSLLRKPSLVITTVPAVLGLLPIAGGALMSAPVVDSLGSSLGLSKARKLFINVWFRHIIFLVYPISSVIILTAALGGTDVITIAFRQLPVAAVMVFTGFLIGLRLGVGEGTQPHLSRVQRTPLARALTPIVLAVVIALALLPINQWLHLPIRNASVAIGVLTSLLLTLALTRNCKALSKALLDGSTWSLIGAAYGAMLFRESLVRANLALTVAQALGSAINPVMLSILIPAALSFITGASITSIAISLPIIQAFTSLSPEVVSLAYAAAFIGYLPSPLHLCYIYTAQYLRTHLIEGYRYMVPALAVTALAAYLTYALMP